MDKEQSLARLRYPEWLQIHAKYLEGKFGSALPDVRRAMEELAASFTPEELEERAYHLYVEFRPQIRPANRAGAPKGVWTPTASGRLQVNN